MEAQVIKLTLYNVDDSIHRELTRSRIPWGVLEQAIDLQELMADLKTDKDGNPINATREHIQALTDFVIFLFDDTVTSDELNRKADIPSMMTVYRQIFEMVKQSVPQNPTMGQTKSQRDLQKVRQRARK